MSHEELEGGIDIDLGALVRELREAERAELQLEVGLRDILAGDEPEATRYIKVDDLLRDANHRTGRARAALQSVQRLLSVLLGPPPLSEEQEMRDLLHRSAQLDRELQESGVEFGSVVNALLVADAQSPDLWARFRQLLDRRQQVADEKLRVAEMLVRSLRDGGGKGSA